MGYVFLGQDDLVHNADAASAASSAMDKALDPDFSSATSLLTPSAPSPTPQYNYDVPPAAPVKPKAPVIMGSVLPPPPPQVTPTYVPPPPPEPLIKPWMWWVGGAVLTVGVVVLVAIEEVDGIRLPRH